MAKIIDKITTNAYETNDVLKNIYYDVFMIPEKEVLTIDKSLIHLNLGPGGTGKTYSVVNGEKILRNIGKKIIYIDLIGKETISDIDMEDCETVILDSLNESNDIIKIQKEIVNLVSKNDKYIIVNSRYTNFIPEFLRKSQIYKINTKNSFQSFIHKYRNIKLKLKEDEKILWSIILSLYSAENMNEVNFRTIRTILDSLFSRRKKSSDDIVSWIRSVYESTIRNSMLNIDWRDEWENFKYNIYNFDENKIDMDKGMIHKEEWIALDFVRVNNGKDELRDYNFVDHIISFEISKNIDNELEPEESLKNRVQKIVERVNKLQGYKSDKKQLLSMVIYTYIKWNMNKKIINPKAIMNVIEAHNSKATSLSGMIFSDFSIVDSLQGIGLTELEFNIQDIEKLNLIIPLWNIPLKNIPALNTHVRTDYIDNMKILLSGEKINFSSTINLIKILLKNAIHFEEDNINSEYSGEMEDLVGDLCFTKENTENLNKALISLKREINKNKNLSLKDKRKHKYTLLILIKSIQNNNYKKGEFIEINKNIFKCFRRTLTYYLLNKKMRTFYNYKNTNDYFNEEESKYIGHFNRNWTLQMLNKICDVTNAPFDYHTNEIFIKFTKKFSKRYLKKDKTFNYQTKNKYIYDDDRDLKRNDYMSLIKLDEFLLKNKNKYFIEYQTVEEELVDGESFVVWDGVYSDGSETNDIEKSHLLSNNTFSEEELLTIHSISLYIGDGLSAHKIIKKYAEILFKKNIYVGNSLWTKANGANIWSRNHNYFIIESQEIRERWKEFSSGNYQNVARRELSSININNNNKIFYDDNNSIYVSKEVVGCDVYFKFEKAVTHYGTPRIKNDWEYIQGKIKPDGSYIYSITTEANSHTYDSKNQVMVSKNNGYDEMDYIDDVISF